MILKASLYLLVTTAIVYALLLTSYSTTGLVIFCNDPARADKIQQRRALSAQKVRRDILQCVRSLSSIALMFSIGQTLYSQCHVGRPVPAR